MKQKDIQKRLTEIFIEAEAAAVAADPGLGHDMGTCNCDTPAFRLPRVPFSVIEAAAKDAGVSVSAFTFIGRKAYWVFCTMKGQSCRRTTMMEAAQKVLNAVKDIPGWTALGYYQMD